MKFGTECKKPEFNPTTLARVSGVGQLSHTPKIPKRKQLAEKSINRKTEKYFFTDEFVHQHAKNWPDPPTNEGVVVKIAKKG